MSYNRLNIILGWSVFLIATIVYFITIEDTVSLWDCGEYITAAYKLEVGHPPGAPLFMVLGRLFSFFADPEMVAVWINRLSAISSSLTILFMFWTLTILLKKLALKNNSVLGTPDKIAIFGGAFVGSLAYTFSDSFWFSAVEGEVYAMSSLFTAVIFWAIMKWDEEMSEIKFRQLSNYTSPDRWLLLIMFLLGLAIGVHLLGILVVPAICYVIYFQYRDKVSLPGVLITGALSIFILGFIQEGIIPGSISLASWMEVMFVNSFGLPFFSGSIFFLLLLVGLSVGMVLYARKNRKSILYNATMGLILLIIGYGSFAVIVIRSNANTPLDENDPENLVTLHAYLKREQYGSAPLFKGQYWNSEPKDYSQWENASPTYLRRFVVVKGNKDIKGFISERAAEKYATQVSGKVIEKYFASNLNRDKKTNQGEYLPKKPTYNSDHLTFFPRMYSEDPRHIPGYMKWSGYDPTIKAGTKQGRDKKRLPTFGENMTYFMRYQVNWMYWRYFMWNFAGRQNDIQGNGDNMRGNWLSGFDMLDNARLGDQANAPYFTKENPANNQFFFIPLIIGLIGLFYHFYRSPKDAFVVFLAFLFTGLAIVIYLNQKPFEPRERDYAYAGSFYFFTMWIGIGVYALYEAFARLKFNDLKVPIAVAGGGLLLFMITDVSGDYSMPNTIAWLLIAGISLLFVGGMMGLKKLTTNNSAGASVAVLIGFIAPLIMGIQGFDDHDRSLKTSAHDLAINYLNSCAKNSILFTNGDNDTFPLWYMQEVEGKRTDVRVCNLSLMQTDWYTDQMKMRINSTPDDPNSGSAPLPIKFTEDQILMHAGNTDGVYLYFSKIIDLLNNRYIQNADENYLKKVINLRINNNKQKFDQTLAAFNAQAMYLLQSVTAKQPNDEKKLLELKEFLTTNKGSSDADIVLNKYRSMIQLLTASSSQGGTYTISGELADELENLIRDFEKPWSAVDVEKAMAFVRDDNNILRVKEPGRAGGERKMRIFPTSNFDLVVNRSNAVKSGIIRKDQDTMCLDTLNFSLEGEEALSREEVMMLDILGNNKWERGIYFSSPNGSKLADALYKRGYIKQHGMVFVLSPLNDYMENRFTDEMYDLIMGIPKKDKSGKDIPTYTYGAMSNPDVLTDYYTRRHTSQYRGYFYLLAEDFIRKAENFIIMASKIEDEQDDKEEEKKEKEEKRKILITRANEYREKAKKLILRSLEVMPANVVIDYGEPHETRQEFTLGKGQIKVNVSSDGILHSYVGLLYEAGDMANAEKLGKTIADQLESIIKYFETSDPYFAANLDNTADLYAALNAYFILYNASNSENGNGALAKRTKAKLSDLYNSTFPKLYKELQNRGAVLGKVAKKSKNEDVGYTQMLTELNKNILAIGVHYKFVNDPYLKAPQQQNQSLQLPPKTN